MTWLLKLYPSGWRRRYGDEFTKLIAAQSFSLATTIDVLAGAIDAWIHPQMAAIAPRATRAEGDENMLARMMKFRCAGYGPTVTASDQWKSAIATVGGTVVLAGGWMWLHVRIGDNPYSDSLSLLPVIAALLFGMRYTYLKGRSGWTQAVFIGGNLALLTGFFLLVGWIASRL